MLHLNIAWKIGNGLVRRRRQSVDRADLWILETAEPGTSLTIPLSILVTQWLITPGMVMQHWVFFACVIEAKNRNGSALRDLT